MKQTFPFKLQDEPISAHNLIARLLEAVPEFKPDQDDLRDRLNYLVFNSLVTFISELNRVKDRERFGVSSTFLSLRLNRVTKAVVDIGRDARLR